MRQLFSRVFDVALGTACALMIVGSARPPQAEPARPPDTVASRAVVSRSVESAYHEASVSSEVEARVDPRTAWLANVVARGRHARLETPAGPVHVWAPHAYDAATAITVVYVHGYHQDADAVWKAHRLPEQFALSGINALFVVPEAPVGKRDPIAWGSVTSLLAEVARGMADLALPAGSVAVVGHSGAYRTVIHWLGDRRIDTVALLDAAYVDVMPYRAWVIASKRRRLLNVSIDTIRWSNGLHRSLPSSVVVKGFPREITDELRAARILYIRSDIGHWPLVTEGVALPAVVRMLHGNRVLGELPPLGLPPSSAPAEPLATASRADPSPAPVSYTEAAR